MWALVENACPDVDVTAIAVLYQTEDVLRTGSIYGSGSPLREEPEQRGMLGFQ
jgi:hypothetical protein